MTRRSGQNFFIKPLDDPAYFTVSYLECALGMFLAGPKADDLDEGQRAMLEQAHKRMNQVSNELHEAEQAAR